jgi:DNA-binding transcriptional regulator LsrR (DeoR family)
MARRRTANEVEELLEQYRASGMTKIAYCQQMGISRSTLSRYLRRRRRGRLVRVNLKPAPPPEPDRGFVLVLSNGRRIESGWRFGETELARLIRVAEGV